MALDREVRDLILQMGRDFDRSPFRSIGAYDVKLIKTLVQVQFPVRTRRSDTGAAEWCTRAPARIPRLVSVATALLWIISDSSCSLNRN